MTAELPDPMVPAEVDLRDFQYMELDVRLLRDSRFGAEVSGDAFRAGVMLWCASWHQVPAGSIPDDDIELANLAGYGRFVKEWKKERAQALQGFVRCSDGRLYHQTVCKKAAQAWESKLRHHYDRARDRLRKANKARVAAGQAELPELSFEVWNSQRIGAGVPMEKAEASAGIPQNVQPTKSGIPPENALRGNGEGTEKERNGDSLCSEAIASGAAAPPATTTAAPAPPSPPPESAGPPPTDVDTIFAVGLPMLLQAHVPERNARTFLGHLRKLAGKGQGGDKAVVDALNRCVRQQALDPVTFLQACFTAKQPAQDPSARNAEAMRLLGIDSSQDAKKQDAIDA